MKKMRDSKSVSQYDWRHWDTARRCQKPSHLQGEGLDGVRLAPWQQDGIAPQCPVPGLLFDQTVPTSPLPNSTGTYQAGRIKFDGKTEHLNFLEAHYGENYDWIFKIPADDPDGGGVRKRN